MIDGERKIKELYNCEYITSDKELYPLQKWYNKLIDKSIDEIKHSRYFKNAAPKSLS